MTQQLARALRRYYAEPLPARYQVFLAQEQYEDLEYLNLRNGFVEGCFLPAFAEYRKLRDVELMAHSSGVDGLTTFTWATEFRDFLPLASLEPVHEWERRGDVGAFLVIRSKPADCPVFVLVREGLMLIPLASSLSAFMRGHAWRDSPSVPHRRLGRPYESFGWSPVPRPRQLPRMIRAR